MRATAVRLLVALLLTETVVAAACGSGNGIGGDTAATAPRVEATEHEAAPVVAPHGAIGGDTADAVVPTQGGNLLRTVQERGRLVCGVSGTRVIFSETQPDGSVVGVDADYCRAAAAAVLGDAGPWSSSRSPRGSASRPCSPAASTYSFAAPPGRRAATPI